MSLTPATLDVTAASQSLTFTAVATDDLSGVSSIYVYAESPTGGQTRDAYAYPSNRTLGSALNGTYSFALSMPRFSEAGTWRITGVDLRDVIGNSRSVVPADLASMGTPTTFTVISTGDVVAPSLSSFSLTPASVNVTAAAQSITFSATATDALSGVSSIYVYAESPTGGQTRDAYAYPSNRTSGTAQSGTYSFALSMPQFSEGGMWRITGVDLRDVIGNSRSLVPADLTALGSATTFSVVSTQDVSAPQLLSFGFTPGTVNTAASSQTITFTARSTDDLSGVSSIYVYAESPTGGQTRDAYAYPSNRISGTAQDGNYSFALSVPRYSETGTWRITGVDLRDVIGNSRSLIPADVTALGSPTTFVVQ